MPPLAYMKYCLLINTPKGSYQGDFTLSWASVPVMHNHHIHCMTTIMIQTLSLLLLMTMTAMLTTIVVITTVSIVVMVRSMKSSRITASKMHVSQGQIFANKLELAR